MNNVKTNIFKSLTVSNSFASISIEDVMTAIRTGAFKFKTTTVFTGAETASKEDKYSTDIYMLGKNKYNYLKINSVMTWCPNASFLNNHRHTSSVDSLTGFIYCDIDGIDPNEAKALLSTLPFVYSVWASLSGTGVGFLVKADWNLDNFKSNYKGLAAYFLAEHKLELDKTSDFTRTNCFSYDPDVIINENASNIDSTLLIMEEASTIRIKGIVPTHVKVKATKVKAISTYTQSNFDTLLEELDVTIDYPTKVKQAIGYAGKSKGSFVDGNRHNFLTSLIGIANKMSIPYDILVEEFESFLVNEDSLDLFDIASFDTIYASFEHQKASVYENLLNLSSIKTLVPTQSITVEKYLDNQVPTTYTKNTILVSATGSGKSTYVMEQLKGKRVIVCPNTSILINFKSFKGVTVFYGDEKSEIFSDIILTTQDSFELLTTVLDNRGDSILNYLIVIDEFHTLVTSANKGYKYRAINNVISILEENPLVVLGLTATPIQTVTSKFYNTFDVIEVTQKTDVKREIQLSVYDDYRSFIIERCLSNYKAKTISVVYKNSKSSVDVLAEALQAQGLTVAIINADTKESINYRSIVQNGDVVVDVILTTCLMKEGVSVKGRGDNVSVDYIVTGDTHFSEVNQLASRVRNANKITITLASSVNSYKDYSMGFLFNNVVEQIDANNSFLLNRVNELAYTEAEIKLDQRLGNTAIKYDETRFKFVVDSVYKDFLIYEAEKKVCTINPLYTIVNLLQDSRFDVHPSLVVYSEDNKQAIEEAKAVVATQVSVEKLDFKTMVDTCTSGTTVLEKLDAIRENGSKEAQSMAYYTKFVYARMKKANLYAAIDKATILSDSSRKFNEFLTQLELTELFTSKDSKNGISTLFFKELQSTIKINKDYTNNQIHDLMQAAAIKTGAKEFISMTKNKSTQWFSLLGTISERKTTITVNGNRQTVRLYTLTSFGLSNYNYKPNYEDKDLVKSPVSLISFLTNKKIVNPFLSTYVGN